MKSLAAIHKLPIGAPIPVPRWKRDLEKARRDYKLPPLPVPAPPVHLGYRLAAISRRADGAIIADWLSPEQCQAFMHAWAENETTGGAQNRRLFN